ncbi:MAG: TonB-dependent receptor plug domain-containing protein, partial [Thermoanaerobaculia bacterium]
MSTDERRPSAGLLPLLAARAALAATMPAGAAGGADDVKEPRCAGQVKEAERLLRAGRIDDVSAADLARDFEKACFERAASRKDRTDAYAVLAQMYIAEERSEKAAEAVAALVRLDPDYRPLEGTPFGRFLSLVDDEKKSATFTYGVSKSDEPLSEAPATVVVVKADEIERRGYLDLEQVLHDLPGFDISRGNGDVYSNLYLRGYRSDRSDRMLLVIDGIEQNDLHSNTAYLSRQYPLSNVRQVEVVYGPASTIYGANAFTGVVNVTTKRPEDMLADGESVGVTATVAGGDFGTRYLDATVAGQALEGKLGWSLTGRVFNSDENDLSGFADWDFDSSVLDDFDYQQAMLVEGPEAAGLADSQAFTRRCTRFGVVLCKVAGSADAPTIELTPDGADLARERDFALFDMLDGRDFAFTDET